MIERVALLLILSLAAMIACYLLRAIHMRRIRAFAPHPTAADTPALLYFRADSCAVCPAQGRIIDQLGAHWHGHVRMEIIDAEREPETAACYHVFTLPTTILHDADGRVRQVNYGLTDERKLNRQLTELTGGHPADSEPAHLPSDRGPSGIQSAQSAN